MFKSKCASILWPALIIGAGMAYGAEIYVSPTGNDANPGTIDSPLVSLTAARDKADQLKAGSTPVTVYLRGGTYYLSAPIVFGPSNSGTESAPIVYAAYNYERPVLSGGIKVTGATWAVSSGPIMKTTIATDLKVDQLFLNGRRQVMARYPNFNENLFLQGYASDALTKAGACLNPAEGPGYIRALHVSLWGGEDYKITGKSGGSVAYAWVGDNNRGQTMHKDYKMVENIFELLDTVGEWYYRKSTGELFFWPPAGTDLGSATIELASLTELLRFVGSGASSANSVKYIQFDGVTLTHTYRSLFDSTGAFYELITKSDWGMVRKGTVFMQNAENITIKNCLFDQIGGNGVFCSGYNRNHVIYNNDFEDAGASCVCLFGLRSSIRCPNSWSTTDSCTDKTPGPLTEEYPSFISVENNMMNHGGRFEKQTAGYTCSATRFDTIRHNTIHNIPRAGINFCDGAWGGNVIDYNLVYDCVKESGDHGPFNAWGRDRNERFQDDPAATFYDAVNTTYIRNNRFEGAPGNFGIDLDDQASNYYQENNLCIGGGHKLQWTRYNTYLNNIIVDGNVQFHGVWTQSHHYGAHIIIYQTREPCIYQFCCGSDPTQVKSVITQWDSNVVYTTKGEPKCSNWNDCSTGNFTWAQWTGAGLDAHSKVADPLFTDPLKDFGNGKPLGDYSVKPGSPALTLGFKNFPMDSFGVMGVAGPRSAILPFETKKPDMIGQKSFLIRYRGRHLTVSGSGDYQVAVLSPTGRTLTKYNGKGRSDYLLNTGVFGSGVYFAVVTSKKKPVSLRFIVCE
jgi:hypothetical protein